MHVKYIRLIRLIVLNIFLWGCIHYFISFIFLRIPNHVYLRGPLNLKSYSFEANGKFWDQWFRVSRWKDRLPEGSQFFSAGFNKRQLKQRDAHSLKTFITEINRAEMTHWGIIFALPIVLVFNPRWTYIIHGFYSLIVNIPFIIVQRYNRPRFEQLHQRQLKMNLLKQR